MTRASGDLPFDIRDHIPGPAGFLGSAANVIMQLGWREVGYGVVESSVDSGNVMLHPWKRLRTTISYLVVAPVRQRGRPLGVPRSRQPLARPGRGPGRTAR